MVKAYQKQKITLEISVIDQFRKQILKNIQRWEDDLSEAQKLQNELPRSFLLDGTANALREYIREGRFVLNTIAALK